MKWFTGMLTNLLVGLVSGILLLFNVSEIDTTQKPVDLSGYELVFADEFDGSKLDEARWRAHNHVGVRRGGYWTPEQARVENGNLIIRTEYKKDGSLGKGWYTAGLSTKGRFEQTNGYFECRCILPKGNGLWSAFWLTNQNVTNLTTGNAKKGAEIDVFESPYWHLGVNRRNKVTSNIHFNGYDLQTRYKNVGITALDNDPYENFNTYAVQWTPDAYIFYINGYEVARSKYGGVSEENEYLILSCEVEGADAKPTHGWSGTIESNDKESFAADFIVDYVRAYQKNDPNRIDTNAEVVELYKNAAKNTENDDICIQEKVQYTGNDSGKFVFEALNAEISGNCRSIPGDYDKLTAADIAGAKAVDDGKCTTLTLTLKDCCADFNMNTENRISYGMTVPKNFRETLNSLKDIQYDISNGTISLQYEDAVIQVQIDDATGRIISGTWNYTLTFNYKNVAINAGDECYTLNGKKGPLKYSAVL